MIKATIREVNELMKKNILFKECILVILGCSAIFFMFHEARYVMDVFEHSNRISVNMCVLFVGWFVLWFIFAFVFAKVTNAIMKFEGE